MLHGFCFVLALGSIYSQDSEGRCPTQSPMSASVFWLLVTVCSQRKREREKETTERERQREERNRERETGRERISKENERETDRD